MGAFFFFDEDKHLLYSRTHDSNPPRRPVRGPRVAGKPMSLDHIPVFVAVFVLDCAFAAYVVATAAKRAWPAAVWAAVIMGINGYLAVAWTNNPATIPAAMLGAAAGTWACIRWLKR